MKQPPKFKGEKMKTVSYNVPNINCMHCVHTIKSELSEVKGVSSVNADAATKQVVVEYDTPATEAELEKVLAEINYPVKK
jgi:copper chaperone CopZ